jgi:hypothetical protein
VPLSDVAKFKEVLRLNNIPIERGLFVTTSTFTPRATTIGIRTMDGKQLEAWERRAKLRSYILPMVLLVASLVGTVAAASPNSRKRYSRTLNENASLMAQRGQSLAAETLEKIRQTELTFKF